MIQQNRKTIKEPDSDLKINLETTPYRDVYQRFGAVYCLCLQVKSEDGITVSTEY
jgi:hypothetical protein